MSGFPHSTRPTNAIIAAPEAVSEHIARLWGLDYRELALDVGRDPSDSNRTVVQIVVDARLAAETHDSVKVARRATVAAWLAATAALASTVTAVVLALRTH